ncbi:MAG: NYN domain-containing protein [Thermoanaerobaculia bacterium]|nr:NYN domain-containing protein [Thermoanaerobaculia bacterium]
MDRVAVFVDAGYLFAQGSIALTGEKLSRSQLSLDHQKALFSLGEFAQSISRLPLLRVYWYDGTSTGPTPQHNLLAFLPDLKLRLGFVNSHGQQKGVDSLIVTDMISLARNQAMAAAVLLSGDEDLRVGVQQAQELGVRVHLLGIRPSRGSQSVFLLQEADTVHEWGPAEISVFLSVQSGSASAENWAESPADVVADPLLIVAREEALTLPEAERRGVLASYEGTQTIPREVDGRLLAKGRAILKADLTSDQKRRIRALFLQACREEART